MRSTMGLNLIELPVFAASSKLTDQKLCISQSVKFLENTRSRIFLSQVVPAQTVSCFLRQIGDFFVSGRDRKPWVGHGHHSLHFNPFHPKTPNFCEKSGPGLKKLSLFLSRPNNFGSEVENCISFFNFVELRKVCQSSKKLANFNYLLKIILKEILVPPNL